MQEKLLFMVERHIAQSFEKLPLDLDALKFYINQAPLLSKPPPHLTPRESSEDIKVNNMENEEKENIENIENNENNVNNEKNRIIEEIKEEMKEEGKEENIENRLDAGYLEHMRQAEYNYNLPIPQEAGILDFLCKSLY